ncbi:MAG: hypothetical protein LVS60_11700 [Nodosilinea sp. LVE1205-7]
MAQYLKRWESPRCAGRNLKGRGGSARQRQLRKRQQTLRQQLKKHDPPPNLKIQGSTITGRTTPLPVIFCLLVPPDHPI